MVPVERMNVRQTLAMVLAIAMASAMAYMHLMMHTITRPHSSPSPTSTPPKPDPMVSSPKPEGPVQDWPVSVVHEPSTQHDDDPEPFLDCQGIASQVTVSHELGAGRVNVVKNGTWRGRLVIIKQYNTKDRYLPEKMRREFFMNQIHFAKLRCAPGVGPLMIMCCVLSHVVFLAMVAGKPPPPPKE